MESDEVMKSDVSIEIEEGVDIPLGTNIGTPNDDELHYALNRLF